MSPITSQGRIDIVNHFNRSDWDVVILNRSDATGISLHASEQFVEQRPRPIIVTHCTKASVTDDQGLIEMLTAHIDYFQEKPVELPVAVRWVVERANAWVERCKNLVKNFEWTLKHARAKLNLCFMRLMVIRLAT